MVSLRHLQLAPRIPSLPSKRPSRRRRRRRLWAANSSGLPGATVPGAIVHIIRASGRVGDLKCGYHGDVSIAFPAALLRPTDALTLGGVATDWQSFGGKQHASILIRDLPNLPLLGRRVTQGCLVPVTTGSCLQRLCNAFLLTQPRLFVRWLVDGSYDEAFVDKFTLVINFC